MAVESAGDGSSTSAPSESLGAPTRTEPLVIDDQTGSVDHLADEGWKWDVTGESSGMLTLNGFHLRTSGRHAMEFQDQTSGKGVRKVEIVLIGVNIVEATGMYFGPTVRGGLAGQDSEYTIRQAEGQQGSLEFVNTSDQWNVIEEVPYVFSGASLTIESGTITSNMDFASLSNAFTMNGGTLTIRNDEHWGYAAITSGDGRLTINGGTLNIKSQTGLSAPTYTGDGDGGGIYINGGDITIEGNGFGAALYAMKGIVIDTTGTLRTSNYYWDIYVYNGANGSVEIKQAKELSLGGEIQIWPQDVPATIAPADYTTLNTLIEKAKALNSTDYKDFSAVATALAQAEKIVGENKNLLQQSEVNVCVAALNEAIEALVPKPTPTPPSGGGAVVPSKGLEIMSAPMKTEYAYGENIDLTGLVVSDNAGGELDTDEFVLSGYDATKPGVQKVTATLKEDPEQTASFEVLVMFRDVDGETPHHEEIKTLLEHGVTRGFADGTFQGMSTLKRQDLAAFLYRLAGQPDYEPAEEDFVFADVTVDTPHYWEILWAAKRGVIQGFTAADGTRTFAGDKGILRQDMVAMLYRLAGSPAVRDGGSFADVTADTPHRMAIAWAKSVGVATGFSDGTFKGGNTIVRQDTAAFLGRMIDKNLVDIK